MVGKGYFFAPTPTNLHSPSTLKLGSIEKRANADKSNLKSVATI